MNLIERLSELGHTMPPLGAPAANYTSRATKIFW